MGLHRDNRGHRTRELGRHLGETLSGRPLCGIHVEPCGGGSWPHRDEWPFVSYRPRLCENRGQGMSLKSADKSDRVYARIAAIRGCTPSIWISRFRLYASTCRLSSVRTFGSVFVRKCVAPIHDLSVPNACSTVCRRSRPASGI